MGCDMTMQNEVISVYKPLSNEFPNKTFEYPEEISNCDMIRDYQGFKIRQTINRAFFNTADDTQGFCEILVYKSIDHGSVCELWDEYGEVFKFYCKNAMDEFELICKFMEFSKNRCQYELNMNQLISTRDKKK